MKTSLQVGGLLALPAKFLKRFRLAPGSAFEVLAPHRRLMWLLHDPDSLSIQPDPDSLAMTGDVSAISVADVFSVLNMGQHSGALLLLEQENEKAVFFERGEIIFSSSSDPNERLGAKLVQLGKLTHGQLQEAEKTMRPGVRFGAHLIQHGFLTPDQLFAVLRVQVEEILYSLFTLKEGIFLFYKDIKAPEDLVQFTLNTQNIMMEGFRRLDEWQMLRDKIVSDDIKPQQIPGAVLPPKLGEVARTILTLIDGSLTITDLMRGSGKETFVVYRTLYDLEKLGLITFPIIENKPKKRTPEILVQEFNRLFRTIARELNQVATIDLQHSFNAFIDGLPQNAKAVLLNLELDDEGQLDETSLVKRVREIVDRQGAVAKIAGVQDLLADQTLQNVLNESLNFFLFTARNALPESKANRLIAAIRNVQKNLLDKSRS